MKMVFFKPTELGTVFDDVDVDVDGDVDGDGDGDDALDDDGACW